MGKMVTMKSPVMQTVAKEAVGGDKMRLRERLGTLEGLHLCNSGTLSVNTVTRRDNGGLRLGQNSFSGTEVDAKSFAEIDLFTGLQSLHISDRYDSLNLYPHKWSTSLESVTIEQYQHVFAVLPHLGRLVNLKRLSLGLEGKTVQLPEEVKKRIVYLSLNGCNSLAMLEGCDKLEELSLTFGKDNKEAALETLPKLPRLARLTINGYNACGLAGLEKLPQLEYLNLTHSQVHDLSALEKCGKLNTLGLRYNKLADITPLAKLPLTTMDISDNMVESLEPLRDKVDLVYLDISHNPITSISAIAGCVGLELLNLHDTWVEDISPLVKMQSLVELSLDIRPIRNKDVLKQLGSVGVINGRFYMDFIKQNDLDR